MAEKKAVSPAVAAVVIIVVLVIVALVWFSMSGQKKAETGSMAPKMAEGGTINPQAIKAKMEEAGAGGGSAGGASPMKGQMPGGGN